MFRFVAKGVGALLGTHALNENNIVGMELPRR